MFIGRRTVSAALAVSLALATASVASADEPAPEANPLIVGGREATENYGARSASTSTIESLLRAEYTPGESLKQIDEIDKAEATFTSRGTPRS